MSIYRGAGGAGDAVNDASSEAVLVQQLAIEAQDSADAAATSETNAAASETAAASSASAASTSASNAATSATNASNSASTATTQATNAANSATAAQTAETAAELAETNAETAQAAAASSASAASSSASAASTSATNASNSASSASTSATNASNSATAAATSASNASTSATAAAASAVTAAGYVVPSQTGNNGKYLKTDGTATSWDALDISTADITGTLPLANGGTGGTTAATARTSLGLAIGTNVQAWDADLDTWATKTAPSGTVVGTSDTQTLTNKTIALGSNTVSGTLAQFNTAVTDADLVSLAGTETLTNKTLTSPTLTTPALGTPASGVVTNLTGTASININGTVGATTANTGAFTTLGATGVATFSAGTVSAPAITTTGDTNTGIYFPAADTIAFTEGGAEAMRITSLGRVSIGTTAPEAPLVVSNGGAAGFEFFTNYPGGGLGTYIQSFSRSGGVYVDTAYDAATHSFRTSGTEKMRITSAGNVGIGTSSPNAKLVVTQATAGTTAVVFNGVAARQTFDFTGSGQTYFDQSQINFRKFDTTSCGYLATQTNTILNLSSSTGYSLLAINSATGNSAYLDFFVNSTATARLFSDSNGVLAFATGSSNTERMRIDSSGNVGIGTSSPQTQLNVANATTATLRLTSIGNANLDVSCTSTTASLGSPNGIPLFFTTANAERMRIDNAGNVGIGTSSPDALLSVNGIASFGDGAAATPSIANFGDLNTGFWFPAADTIAASTAGSERMRIDSSGIITATAGNLMLVSATEIASTSGTSIDFTSIPSWVKRVTVMFNAVSTSGTSNYLIQIGDSGGLENTGYISFSSVSSTTSGIIGNSNTVGFLISAGNAAATASGSVILNSFGSNSWTAQGVLGFSTPATSQTAGVKTLSATLDRVRITTVNGTDTFDAGSINILYE